MATAMANNVAVHGFELMLGKSACKKLCKPRKHLIFTKKTRHLDVLLNALPSQVKGYSSKLHFSGAVDPFNFGIQFQYPTKQQEFYGSIRPIHIDFDMKSKPCESQSFDDSKQKPEI